jgi:hypothetical protein
MSRPMAFIPETPEEPTENRILGSLRKLKLSKLS